ncbi:hypothetical protein PybrP1_007133 [[Pythium] brassicae (nom. inval.)]|nr:hypothetical protein PybrP1_007133 [[Pythium] brassicae (nom. inval.)]
MACARPARNTLTSACYGACASPLCVVYAAEPTDAASRIGDGNYYYQGCAFTGMATCQATGTCDVQCLQASNARQESWVLEVAQPQKDKPETSLFLRVENVALPPTLTSLSIIGTTELTRKVPISFAAGVFKDSTALEQVNISDVAIENITSNIFPASLKSLTIQRTQLQQFAPRGNQRFSELRVLDLRDNALTEIPSIVYELRALTELFLQGNPISDAHVTPPQLAFLKALPTFRGTLRLSSDSACQDGFQKLVWSANQTICYGGDDFLGADVDSSDARGQLNETSTNSSASSASGGSRSGAVLMLVAVALFVVSAVVAGVFLLKRAKRKAARPAAAADAKQKLSASALRAKFSSSKSASLLDELSDPLQGSFFRKNDTVREIPVALVRVRRFVAANGAVRVSAAAFNRASVFVLELEVQGDDDARNCELALDVVPVVSRMRHPQLLAVLGLLFHDGAALVPPVAVVCEAMQLGTLEAHLLRRGRELSWTNFKLRAALDVAGGLMYLHTKHKTAYGALNGKSVFVDIAKGCKLNTLLASLPSDVAVTHGAYDSDEDPSSRGFLAPELLVGGGGGAGASRLAADMFAFGVLLAQLDTCLTADEMIRSSWQKRASGQLPPAALLSEVGGDGGSSSSRFTTASSASDLDNDSTSLFSMFPFTEQCPLVVAELARACLQYDPSLRPSASYVVAMLQQLC